MICMHISDYNIINCANTEGNRIHMTVYEYPVRVAYSLDDLRLMLNTVKCSKMKRVFKISEE